MDWIRRNWPDLLIGVALVAVIAGIIITLLSGGSFSMFDRSRRTVTTPNQTTTTNSPFSSPEDTTPTNTTADTTPTNTTNTTANNTTTTPTTTPDQTNAANTNTGAGIEPILPDLPVADTRQPADTNTTTTANTTANTTATATPETTTATTTANVASTPIPPAAAGTAPYRVSVGAFGQRQNAETLANTFRELGYPVFVAQEGDFFITLVGPYEQESAANQVAERIRAEGNDALVYRLSDPEPETAAQPAQAAAPAASTPAPAETTTTTTPTQSNPDNSWTNRGGTYLQVGAYASLESSLPQRRRLESLGFNVSERFSDELVRLVIGPFTEAEVPVAQAQLSANGIDNFPVQ